MVRPEPSGEDISFLALESSDAVSRDRIRTALAEAAIDMTRAVVWHDDGSPGRWQLIEVDGFVPEGDERLERFAARMDEGIGRITVLGGYPKPPAASAG